MRGSTDDSTADWSSLGTVACRRGDDTVDGERGGRGARGGWRVQGVEGIVNRFVNFKKMSKMSKMWSTLWSEQGQETMLIRSQNSSPNRNELGMIFIFKILNHRFIL